MSRRETLLWVGVMIASALAVAWLVERRHVLTLTETLRKELDAWGTTNEPS